MIDNIKIIHLKSNAQNLESWNAYDVSTNEIIGHIFMSFEIGNKINFLGFYGMLVGNMLMRIIKALKFMPVQRKFSFFIG